MTDPLRGLSTAARLWAAVLLTLLPLGYVWSVGAGMITPGFTLYGDCGYNDGPYCTPDRYVSGYATRGSLTMVSQAPVRVLLLAAAAGFVVASWRRTATTRRLAKVATGALVGALALALSHRDVNVVLLLAAALAFAAPPVFLRDDHGVSRQISRQTP